MQCGDLLLVLLQQAVDGGDIGVDLLDRTSDTLRIARNGYQILARSDLRQILGDGVDVGKDGLDQRIFRADHRFERIALSLGLLDDLTAHARYKRTCGAEYQ